MKIYGKHKQIAERYFEVTYTEYREDGTVKQTGTEDFTPERWNKQTHMRSLYTWDGINRNRGGYRMFDFHGVYVVDDPRAFKKYAQAKYPDAALISVRTH